MQKARLISLPLQFEKSKPSFHVSITKENKFTVGIILCKVLGRLASQIATVVQGKDKPTYTPYREDGDMCIVLNAKDICVTGRKMTDKFYRWHTGQVFKI